MSSDRLAVLAHEIRSPVAALVAIAAALGEGTTLESGDRRRLVELAVAACRNVERLVLDASTASVVPSLLDVSRVVHDASDAARLAGGAVRVEIEAKLPLVRADPERLRQALDNLIRNALGHAPAGTDVLVEARLVREQLRVSVSDAGSGIPADELERVFQPGIRLTGERPGQGLGLAIVRAIAEAHGGTVELRSSPGQGATFTLVLPASAARA